jgi:hypothetical protein
LRSVNIQPLANEKLIYNHVINCPFQRQFRKEGDREFNIDTSHFNHSRFKILLEGLLLGILKKVKQGDSWHIEYTVKDENDPRYQVLSRMNEDKLKHGIDTY